MSITLLDNTTKNPLELIGRMASVCVGSSIEDKTNLQKRAIRIIQQHHERVLEYPEVYFNVRASAKMIRELYTHIGGSPTRLQASTRYIDYSNNFEIKTPASIQNNELALSAWNHAVLEIESCMHICKMNGIPVEDFTNILPLAYMSEANIKMNLRTLKNFFQQRLCTRAYWEIRDFANDLKNALEEYSPEWKIISKMMFFSKCAETGTCYEKQCCGMQETRHKLLEQNLAELGLN